MSDVVVDGCVHHELHGGDHAVGFGTVLDDQGIRHVGVEHHRVGGDQQHPADHPLTVGDVSDVDLEEPLPEDGGVLVALGGALGA